MRFVVARKLAFKEEVKLALSLEAEMFDEHRRETFFMLDLHAVEDAAVRIDADEEFFAGLKLAQDLCWVTHKFTKE